MIYDELRVVGVILILLQHELNLCLVYRSINFLPLEKNYVEQFSSRKNDEKAV